MPTDQCHRLGVAVLLLQLRGADEIGKQHGLEAIRGGRMRGSGSGRGGGVGARGGSGSGGRGSGGGLGGGRSQGRLRQRVRRQSRKQRREGGGELPIEIPLVVSNREDLKQLVESHGIPFMYRPIDPSNKEAQEKILLAKVKELGIDFVVLARYMQILSENFIDHYPNNIINRNGDAIRCWFIYKTTHNSDIGAFCTGCNYSNDNSKSIRKVYFFLG